MGKKFWLKKMLKNGFLGGKKRPYFSCFCNKKSKREFMPFISEEISITSERMCLTSEEIIIIGEEMPQSSERITFVGEVMGIIGETINAELRGPAWF